MKWKRSKKAKEDDDDQGVNSKSCHNTSTSSDNSEPNDQMKHDV